MAKIDDKLSNLIMMFDIFFMKWSLFKSLLSKLIDVFLCAQMNIWTFHYTFCSLLSLSVSSIHQKTQKKTKHISLISFKICIFLLNLMDLTEICVTHIKLHEVLYSCECKTTKKPSPSPPHPPPPPCNKDMVQSSQFLVPFANFHLHKFYYSN